MFLKKNKKKKFSPKNENVKLILHTHVTDEQGAYEELFDNMAVECFLRSQKKVDYIG